ncbi:MAG: OB-fold domain-containing protein [Dehalococcoidia bacterium]
MNPATGAGQTAVAAPRIPVKDDFFTSPLEPLSGVRLKGTRCRACGEAFLGACPACENCQSTDLEETILSTSGTLYTYTVIRNRPPGDYLGPDPFVPYAVGLVELPEGLRLVTALTDCDVDRLEVGTRFDLVVEPLGLDASGNEVIGYKFRPVSDGQGA